MPVNGRGEYIFKWKLQNYSSCTQEKGDVISSPIFDIEELNGSQWQVDYYPNGQNKDKKFVSCYLLWKKAHENVERITIDFSIEFLDSKYCVFYTVEFKDMMFNRSDKKSWGRRNFLDLDVLTKKLNNQSQDILIVLCRIKSDKLENSKFSGSEALTTINVDRSSFIWDVILPTFFKYSECITFSILNEYQFEVTLSCLLEHVDVIIDLQKHDAGLLPQKVTFEFTIFDKIGCELNSKRSSLLFDTAGKMKFPDFITKEHLKACKIDRDHYELKLKCDAYVSNDSISSVQKFKFTPSLSLDSKFESCSASVLQDDFQNIFISQKNSDVIIKVDDDEFPAHKLILRARSPVLDAMFDQNMLENQTGVVEITDIESDILKVFLKFLYTGIVDVMDFENAKKLIIAADKYQVSSLVDKCANYLKSVLSAENACEIISIADLVCCDSLKSTALNVIRVNASKILPTSDWSQWIENNVKLATYILTKLSVDVSQKYNN